MRNWAISALVMVSLAWWAVPGSTSLVAEPARPARVEQIPGSDLKRVILNAKAAERLGIATEVVREERFKQWLVTEGTVEAIPDEPVTAGIPAPSAPDVVPVRVRVRLLDVSDRIQALINRMKEATGIVVPLKGDDDDDDDDAKVDGKLQDRPPAIIAPAATARSAPGLPRRRIRPSATDDDAGVGARPTAHYYDVITTDHGLRPGHRVSVRFSHPDSATLQKVIPYSALVYDPHGVTWTYTNPEPLTFVRHCVEVEFIEGDRAVLRTGPPTGTVVVTVGAALLLGIEQKFGQ
jgi:hypothetical protein